MSITFAERDEFSRKKIAEKAITLLQSELDISPMIIDGGWGTGKTEFCHKLISLMMEGDTHHLLYVDAFKADHADEPLMTVLAEVIKLLPNDKAKEGFISKALPAVRYGIKTFAKAGVSHLLKQDAVDIVDNFDKEIQKAADKAIDASVQSILKDHVKAEQSLKALQTALAEISATKPIVLFIDELDRCRPNFAVEMLEIIKHTFDVEGVSFVLITNTQQLKASINHCYGQTVDAKRYLDKFVKFTFTLPTIVISGYQAETIASIDHYKALVKSSPLLEELRLFECGSVRTVERIIEVNNLSLREVETLVRHIEVYVTLTQQGRLKSTTIFGYKMLTMLAITIFSIAPDTATSMLRNQVDVRDIGRILGVTKLTKPAEPYIDEMEILCYIIGKSAHEHYVLYTISDEEEKQKWERETQGYFNNRARGDLSLVCSDAIKAVSLS
jgi:hypothetical protein